jgi:hypothetical protein
MVGFAIIADYLLSQLAHQSYDLVRLNSDNLRVLVPDGFAETIGLLPIRHGWLRHHHGLRRQSLGTGRLATLSCCCLLPFDGPYLEDV